MVVLCLPQYGRVEATPAVSSLESVASYVVVLLTCDIPISHTAARPLRNATRGLSCPPPSRPGSMPSWSTVGNAILSSARRGEILLPRCRPATSICKLRLRRLTRAATATTTTLSHRCCSLRPPKAAKAAMAGGVLPVGSYPRARTASCSRKGLGTTRLSAGLIR